MSNEQKLNELTIENFCNGAANELFQKELQTVIDNIKDKETDYKQPRKITLDFSIIPDQSRSQAILQIESKIKLIGRKSLPLGGIFQGKKLFADNDCQGELGFEKEEEN